MILLPSRSQLDYGLLLLKQRLTIDKLKHDEQEVRTLLELKLIKPLTLVQTNEGGESLTKVRHPSNNYQMTVKDLVKEIYTLIFFLRTLTTLTLSLTSLIRDQESDNLVLSICIMVWIEIYPEDNVHKGSLQCSDLEDTEKAKTEPRILWICDPAPSHD